MLFKCLIYQLPIILSAIIITFKKSVFNQGRYERFYLCFRLAQTDSNLFFRFGIILQQLLHLLIHILGGEAEFLVKDLVRRGETEAVEAPYSTVLADEAL